MSPKESRLSTSVRRRKDRTLPPREDVLHLPDFATAKKILQSVIDLHENSITEVPQMGSTAEFSPEQVRMAFRVVAEDLLTSNAQQAAEVDPTGMFRRIIKRTQYGDLRLALGAVGPDSDPHQLRLDLNLISSDFPYTIEAVLPLQGDNPKWTITYSESNRQTGGSRHGNGRVFEREFKLDEYQNLWRGARWVAINMIHWNDTDVVLPENNGLGVERQLAHAR